MIPNGILDLISIENAPLRVEQVVAVAPDDIDWKGKTIEQIKINYDLMHKDKN